MNCSTVEEQLSAYMDGELAAADRSAVDAHLASCGDCRRAMEMLRAQGAELDAAFGPLRKENEALVERVIVAIHNDRAKAGPRVTWLTPLLAAAAGFLVAFYFFRPAPKIIEKTVVKPTASIAPDPVKKPMAQLAVATGPVEYKTSPDADWKPLETGAGIEKGTWIRTVGKVKCSFDYNDGTEIRLNHDTEVHLETIRKLALSRGQIFTKVSPNEVRFEVKTDQTKIEALGTTLDIAHVRRTAEGHEKKETGRVITTLTVVEGSARMGGYTVQTGQVCQVVNGKEGTPSKAYDLALMTRWVHEILTLKRDDAELGKRVNDMMAMIGQTKMEHLYEEEIRALGDHCVLPLTRYIQSEESRKKPRQRRAAARILADIAGPSSVPDFVGLLTDSDVEVRVAIARGLRRITGEDHGCDDAYWRGEKCGDGIQRWQEHIRRPDSPWGKPKDFK